MTKDLLREYELTVLGQAMNFPDVAQKIALLPDDLMTYPDTGNVFKAIKKVVVSGGIPDITNVCLYCENAESVIHAASKGITSVGYSEKISTVLEWRKRRILKQTLEKELSQIYDMEKNPDDVITEISGIDFGDMGSMENADITETLNSVITAIEKKNDRKVMTGISGLDLLTGGFRPGQLIYLGARPGVGKSALALSIASYAAEHTGRVLLVSLEMLPDEIVVRKLSTDSGIDMDRIFNGNIEDGDWKSLWAAANDMSKVNLEMNCKCYTPLAVRRVASRMKVEKKGLSMIVIDYIQLMKPDTRHKSKTEEVTEISQSLKQMAMELDVPVLCLTQFNRASELDGRKRKPTMAEAKDSGSIEQDANIFLTLYAPDEPKMGTFEWECWDKCNRRESHQYQMLTIEKNRQGRTGYINLDFDRAHMKFTTIIKDRMGR